MLSGEENTVNKHIETSPNVAEKTDKCPHIITDTEGLDGISPLELESFQYSVSPDHNKLQRQITSSTNFTTRKIRNTFTVHFNGDYLKIVGYNNAGKCTIDND